MNAIVTKLYDIDSIEIPAELLEVHADEQAVEQQIRQLSLRCARQQTAERAERGDVVHCRADSASYPDGRTILVFTGTPLPGAEAAGEAVLGKGAGDVVETQLNGKNVTLTVEKVIRRVPVEVNDALIAGLGIEGVVTVTDYRAYLLAKNLEDQQLEQSKAVTRFIMDQMVENSVYSYDEAEMQAYVEKCMQDYRAQAAELGGEDAEEFSEEEMRQSAVYQAKQGWMAEAFCSQIGQLPDRKEVEDQVEQMQEMMSLMGEQGQSRDEMWEMMWQGACLDVFFNYVDQLIKEKTGGSNGND